MPPLTPEPARDHEAAEADHAPATAAPRVPATDKPASWDREFFRGWCIAVVASAVFYGLLCNAVLLLLGF
jgi:hypothetical protein